jgi:hypothetical protein
MADSRELLTHVANFDSLDARDPLQQILPELGQGIAIRGSQTDSGDDDSRILHCVETEIASQGRAESNTSLAS